MDDGGLAQVAAVEMTRSSTVLVSYYKEGRLTEYADNLDVGWERKESDMIYRMAEPLEESRWHHTDEDPGSGADSTEGPLWEWGEGEVPSDSQGETCSWQVAL